MSNGKYCMHIPLYESSCHDTRQRLQNLGHARSENSQILECAAKIIYIKIWKKIKMKILQICIPFSIHYLANFRLTGVLAVLDSLPVQEQSIKTVSLLLGKAFCGNTLERVSFHVLFQLCN